MNASVLSISLFFLFLSGCKKDNPNDSKIAEMSGQHGYKDWFIDNPSADKPDFRCGLFVPPSYNVDKKYPLIIFLHGHTDTTTWNLEWYNEPVVSQDPCIVLTPKCPVKEIYGWGDSWDPRTSPMMQKTYEMIDLVKEALSIDYDRVYVYGTSMGGFGTYGMIQKNPKLFAAAYVVCGGGNPEMADDLVDMPVWIFHGSLDSTVSVNYARDMYQAVHAAGGKQIRYTEYEGVGHNAWDYTGNEITLVPWLLAQRKGVEHEQPEALSDVSVGLNAHQQVVLQWELPTNTTNIDNRIWYTRIFRNGALIKEAYNNQTEYIDSTLSLPGMYNYQLSVVNYFFKESALSGNYPITFIEQ
jgi:predicted esterase